MFEFDGTRVRVVLLLARQRPVFVVAHDHERLVAAQHFRVSMQVEVARDVADTLAIACVVGVASGLASALFLTLLDVVTDPEAYPPITFFEGTLERVRAEREGRK